MSGWPEHVPGQTVHARRGSVSNAFRYGVDYLLIDPDSDRGPWFFSRNRFNLFAIHDRDHGGPRGDGRGASWAREVFVARGIAPEASDRVLLLTQPRFLGIGFNPVSFWLLLRGDDLLAAIAEVNNTFGDRHSYLCARDDFEPIGPGDRVSAAKVFHVSPFQDIAGRYRFAFRVNDDRIAIAIGLRDGDGGLHATLTGPRRRLTSGAILWSAIRRPFGAARVVALIYWQALRLKLKRVPYRSRPAPPVEEVSG
ncbi:DUF1365 family protein [Rhodobacterales bacterium HKCCE2091]|nr:DUF1365 family protein [Rhodobacterales bacterium HKCCE2091]